MANSFKDVLYPTAWGYFDNDQEAQEDADRMVMFIKRTLGNDLLQVEINAPTIWYEFERAYAEYNRLVNESQVKSRIAILLGLNKDGATYEQKYPRNTWAFMERQSEGFSMLAGLGGNYRSMLCYVELETHRQDYNLSTELIGPSGLAVFSDPDIPDKTQIKIGQVYHFSPTFSYRFFNTSSVINYLNNEFSFESFTPETIFYVLPVFEDVLRMGQMQLSHRVRRSNYSYQIVGRTLRVMPTPSQHHPMKLFIRVNIGGNPFGDENDPSEDTQANGASNIANVPLNVIPYKDIAAHGRQWIRECTLAYCKQYVGYVRNKIKTGIPLANKDIQLNGDDLVTHGREDVEKLRDQLVTLLDELTDEKIAERQANEAEQLRRWRKNLAVPGNTVITMG